MKTQIVNVCKLQTSKVMAAMYLVMSLPFVLFGGLFAMMSGKAGAAAWGPMILMVVLYPIIGFVFTFIGAWIYNGVASKIGGIQFTVANVE
jgi:hypothetical protein